MQKIVGYQNFLPKTVRKPYNVIVNAISLFNLSVPMSCMPDMTPGLIKNMSLTL